MAQQFPRIFYWLTPLLACVLTLALVELCLALLRPIPFASEVNMYFEPDPHTGFRLKPNSEGRFGRAIVATVNSHGHRDDEIPLRKPAGTFRIMVLGDSFTMGASVGQNETYAQVLEQLLIERQLSPIDVINAGVGAWGPFQYAQYYEAYGAELAPDLVLIGFFVGNDTFTNIERVDELRTAVYGRRVARDTAVSSPWLTKVRIVLYSSSHLVRFFMNRNRLVVSDRVLSHPGEARDSDLFTKEYLAIQGRRLKRNHRQLEPKMHLHIQGCVRQIVRIKNLADATATTTVVVLIPDENQINSSLPRVILGGELDDYDPTMPQSLLIEKFREESIPVIDLLDDFLADDRRLYMNDTHWSAAGHRLAAEEILRHIRPIVERGRRNPSSWSGVTANHFATAALDAV